MSGDIKEPEEERWCVNHPGVEAVAKCDLCGRPVCKNCFIDLAGKKACPDCKPAVVGEFITGDSARQVRRRRWKPFRIGRNVIKRLREQRHDRFFADLPDRDDEYLEPEKPDPKELYMQWLRDTEKNSTIDEELFWVGLVSLVFPFLCIIAWVLFSKYRRDVKEGYHNPSIKAVTGYILSFIPLSYLGYIFYRSLYI